jgi:hypothetical protein
MILEKQTEANIEQTGDSQESIGMSLDMDSAQVLMQMLSKNLYSDAVGSTIRECASNALDSHRRAGTTDPIIVSFDVINGQWEFAVEDFGIGLDADDVKNIISKYGKSTKRNSTTELGMMGLGFKAPLAYSSSFYFVCRKDGVERKYMMYEGEDTNTIDLMYEKSTTERNGVKVIVPVKQYDRHEFRTKIKSQLAYFQDVYFKIDDMDNQFTIYRGEHFQWSELTNDHFMHLCLDDVYYPLEFSKLGIDTIDFPVGLRFGLSDGIFPTPNRESLRYTKEAKAIILEKIGKVADFYINKYNEDMKETESLQDVVGWFSGNRRHVKVGENLLNISSLVKYSKSQIKQPTLKGLNYLTSRQLYDKSSMFMMEYEAAFMIDNGKMRKLDRSWHKTVDWEKVLSGNYDYYLYSDRIGGNMKDYIKSLNPRKSVYFVRKTYDIPLRKALKQETYHFMLQLSNHPKSEWRAIIKEWQYVVSIITSKFKNLDDVVIPQSFLDAKKKKRVSPLTGQPVGRKVRLQGDIIGKLASPLERYVDGQHCKFVSTTFKLQNMHKLKTLHVYGLEKDKKQMDLFFKAFRESAEFVIFSDREFNGMQKIKFHNWMSMEQFIKGENKPFKRIATAYLIENLTDEYRMAFRSLDFIGEFSSDMREKMEKLNEYERIHLKWSDRDIKKAILEVAEPNKLFDMEIYPIYKEIKAILDSLPFINVISGAYKPYNDEDALKWKSVMRDLFRFNKRRMDWKNYKITLNEDVVSPITEEIINEA